MIPSSVHVTLKLFKIMDKLIFKISDINALIKVKEKILKSELLSPNENDILNVIFLDLPASLEDLFPKDIDFDLPLKIQIIDLDGIMPHLTKWKNLFCNLPGHGISLYSYIVGNDSFDLVQKNIILCVGFSPTYAFHLNNKVFELHLKTNGLAEFWLPTGEDAKNFPQLLAFSGNWKEAYFLLVHTMLNGWSQTEFPFDLELFLKS